MKKTILALTSVTLLLGLSGCLPKTSSTTSSSNSTPSSSTSPWWSTPTVTATPTATATYWWTPTPTATATGTTSPCGDPLGDCTGSYPVVNLPISNKRGAQSTEAANTYNSWNSQGLGFTTDGRLRLRLAVNAQPDRSNCGVTGSYRWPAYTKLAARIAVKLSNGSEIWSTTTGNVIVGQQSQIYDVPVANFPSAYPYIVQVDSVKGDTTCVWQTNANGATYCNNPLNAAWCGCPVAPDPTNCWSVNLQVVTSQTNNFK